MSKKTKSVPNIMDLANPKYFDLSKPYPRNVDELIKLTVRQVETDFILMDVYSLREKCRLYSNWKDLHPQKDTSTHKDWIRLYEALVNIANYIMAYLPELEVKFYNRKKKRTKEEGPLPEWSECFRYPEAFIDIEGLIINVIHKYGLNGPACKSLINLLKEKTVLTEKFSDKILLQALNNHYGTSVSYSAYEKAESQNRPIKVEYKRRWNRLNIKLGNKYIPFDILRKSILEGQ